MGWQPRGLTPDALWFGTGVHLALARWYCGPGAKRGPHPAETWSDWAAEDLRALKTTGAVDDDVEVRYVDARALGIVMMEGYVKEYGRDEHKLIIQPEKTFSITVPWPADQKLYPDYKPDSPLVRYVGTYDSTWRDAASGRLFLDEHKTAASISTGHLNLDPQAGSYWATAGPALRREGLIGPRERLAGIEYNFLRKGMPDERLKDPQGYATNKPTRAHYIAALVGQDGWTEADLKRHKLEGLEEIAAGLHIQVLGERSKNQPAKNFHRERVYRTSGEQKTQLLRLQSEAIHMMAVKDGVLPVLKNPDRHCGFCPFEEMCEMHEAGADWQDYRKAAFQTCDPYADHRLPQGDA